MKKINGTISSELNNYKIEVFDEFGESAGYLKNESEVAYEEDDEIFFSKPDAFEICRNFNFNSYHCRAYIRTSDNKEVIF